jgi:hypothetical protein
MCFRMATADGLALLHERRGDEIRSPGAK